MKNGKDVITDLVKRGYFSIMTNDPEYVVLSKTKEYCFLKKILPEKENPLWDRVLLNKAAQLIDLDLFYYGFDPADLLPKMVDVDVDDLISLMKYYYGINLSNAKWIEADEYYLETETEKFDIDTISILVSTALANDFNDLNSFVEGILKALPREKFELIHEMEGEGYFDSYKYTDLDRVFDRY